MTNTCTVCTNPVNPRAKASGLCTPHYRRHLDGKDLYAPLQLHSPRGTTAYDKVMALSIWDGNCFVFTRALDSRGYGRIGIPGTGRSTLAHRVVMEHHFGPSKLYVLHSCNNPPCVRIEHLRYGTQAANMADAIASGHLKGRALSDIDIAAIRSDPRQQVDIAAEYGITQGYVSQIRSMRYRK